jgi:prophage antirepressor-like protein
MMRRSRIALEVAVGVALQVFEFEGRQIRHHYFRGRPCWVARDVGEVLGYTREGFTSAMREWSEELIDRKDIQTLRGSELREFKALAAEAVSTSAKTTQLTILYESGIDLVCLKTEKPLGRKLRRFMADKVMPALRRGTLQAESALARELVELQLCMGAREDAETIWEIETVNEICRLYGKPKWNGEGRFPHWIQEPLGRIYRIVLGDEVYRELKQRNPDPRDGSLNYQFLTEARHRAMKSRDMERVVDRLRESRSRDEFFARLAFVYKRSALQLGWG